MSYPFLWHLSGFTLNVVSTVATWPDTWSCCAFGNSGSWVECPPWSIHRSKSGMPQHDQSIKPATSHHTISIWTKHLKIMKWNWDGFEAQAMVDWTSASYIGDKHMVVRCWKHFPWPKKQEHYGILRGGQKKAMWEWWLLSLFVLFSYLVFIDLKWFEHYMMHFAVQEQGRSRLSSGRNRPPAPGPWQNMLRFLRNTTSLHMFLHMSPYCSSFLVSPSHLLLEKPFPP